MSFKQRKKDIADKMRYLQFSEKDIKKQISRYNLIGIIFGDYLKLEAYVNSYYNFIKRTTEETKNIHTNYEKNKSILYGITSKLPIITSKPSLN